MREFLGWHGDTADIRNLSVTGNIKSTKGAGGIVGYVENQFNKTEIINCTNYANIYGPEAGGFVGYYLGYSSGFMRIADCVNYGNVTGDSNAGGMIGSNMHSTVQLKYCANSGEVLAQNAGGMIGYGNATILSCCATNESKVKTPLGVGNAGGMVGYSYLATSVYNSMNTGSVTAGQYARTVSLV